MSSRRSVKKLAPAPESGPAVGGAVARLPSKSKEQVDYLVTHYQDFLTHQTAVTLDRFWLRVYEGWYKRWPITPTPGATKGSAGDARTENNQVRIITFLCLVLLLTSFLNRNFARGSIIGLVPLPKPQNPTCDWTKPKNGNSLLPKHTALTPGIRVSVR
jgi:hypothetical protein